jgi:transcriptional regulator with XRE-family HTH domain
MGKSAFSEWLLEQMKSRNWSQAELAKATGLTRTAISSYINQKRTQPDPQALPAIAKALHVSPINLFKIANLLPNDRSTEEEERFSDWKEVLSKLNKRDQALLKQMAINMIESGKK